MRKYSCYVHCACVFLFFTAGCGANTSERNMIETNSGKDSMGYSLMWSDEFNGNDVDTGNWVYDIGGDGWGNLEQEYYQAVNASVANGVLTITGKKERIGDNHYTSARIKTKSRQEFLYGKIEARIKIPVGQGIWPGILDARLQYR